MWSIVRSEVEAAVGGAGGGSTVRGVIRAGVSLARFAAILRPPSYSDEHETQAAYMLHVVLWGMVLVPLPYLAWALVSARELGAATVWRVVTQAGRGEAVNAALIVVMRRGHVRLASLLQSALLWTFFLWSALTGSGICDLAYVLGFPIVIEIAGLLLGLRGALVAAGASVAAGGAMLLVETGGRRFGPASTPGLVFAITAALFPIFATLQYLGFRSLRRALAQARQELSARRKAEEERERLQGELAHAQRVESIGRLAGGSPTTSTTSSPASWGTSPSPCAASSRATRCGSRWRRRRGRWRAPPT